MSLILLACVFSTFAMTGLIWLIQQVSYPLLAMVPEDHFVAFENGHCRRITPVVLPLMTCELVTSAWLTFRPIAGLEAALITGGLFCVLLWVSTFFVQVPLHQQLERGFDQKVWRRLVLTNWIRTAIWSARSILMAWVLWQVSTSAAHELSVLPQAAEQSTLIDAQ